ncbi:dolichyl-P-Man:Man(5)GlcNAc(2)-PP-dolichol alpha-1,3-mannosyltransferase [Blastocladiella emersonii ATCC 22665]|nr:dolichyl-P-Man:Man(5)GlcNAc(2)-PP-dolichol alpha-1,3-mannosyltransferase [Blastocladiella emersonii ATCC 22665]
MHRAADGSGKTWARLHAGAAWVAAVAEQHTWACIALLVLAEAAFNVLLISRVPYTEIDWSTYMQQVALVAAGETDYSKIEGDTGPLVYPAGHVWIYRLLSALTQGGRDIRLGQYIFAGVYCLNLAATLALYRACRVPVLVYPLLSLSKRIHSIHVLRLFNDPFATLLTTLAVLALVHRRRVAATALLSLGVSVKMNVLLVAPALLYTLVMECNLLAFLTHLVLAGSVQALVAFPFLLAHPAAYLARAFDLSRVFEFKWTVNWRFLPESLFVSRAWGLVLLGTWLACVIVILVMWNARFHGGLSRLLHRWFLRLLAASGARSRPIDIATLCYTINLVGIITARSLHYQFYVWYWFSLPLLLTRMPESVPWLARLAVLATIEVCWNVFPSTNASSAALLAANCFLLCSVLAGVLAPAPSKVKSE